MQGKKFWNQQRQESVVGMLFITPELFGIMLLGVFPLLFSLYLSL
jgi:multiple sugar transport system permease protein